MTADEILDTCVRAVAQALPRMQRDDVALELRALLGEELAARARAIGRTPDRARMMALLKDHGRPMSPSATTHARH